MSRSAINSWSRDCCSRRSCNINVSALVGSGKRSSSRGFLGMSSIIDACSKTYGVCVGFGSRQLVYYSPARDRLSIVNAVSASLCRVAKCFPCYCYESQFRWNIGHRWVASSRVSLTKRSVCTSTTDSASFRRVPAGFNIFIRACIRKLNPSDFHAAVDSSFCTYADNCLDHDRINFNQVEHALQELVVENILCSKS